MISGKDALRSSLAILLTLLTGACAPTHRDMTVEEMLTMPYDHVDFALSPKDEGLPKRLPELNPGESILFFLDAKGKAYMRPFEQEKRIRMSQPLREPELTSTFDKGVFDIAKTKSNMAKVGGAGNIAPNKKAQTVGVVHEQGNVTVSKVNERLQEHSLHDRMQTSRHNIEAETAESEAGVSSAEGSVDTKGSSDSAKVASQSGSASMEEIHGAFSSSSIYGKSHMEQLVGGTGRGNSAYGKAYLERLLAGASGDLSAYDKAFLSELYGSGLTGGIDELERILTLFDKYFKGLVDEYGQTTGITDEDYTAIVIDDMYVPTVDEMDKFRMLVECRADLLELLDRRFSAGFRDADEKNSGYNLTADLFSIVDEDKHYHGHPVGLISEVKNNGETPIYDAVIVTAVPENTTFFSFLAEQPVDKGYMHFYLPECNLVVTKVYRPIFPGETFNDLAVYRFNPWDIQVAAKKNSPSQDMAF